MSDNGNPSLKKDSNVEVEDLSEKYNPAINTQIDVNTWIASFMTEIELVEYYNDDLFEVYNEEFVNFDISQFKKCSEILLRKLKNFLFDQGVYTRKSNVSHARALSEIIGKDENLWPADLTNPSIHVGSYKTNNFISPKLAQSRKNVQGYFKREENNDYCKNKEKQNQNQNEYSSTEQPKTNTNYQIDHRSQLSFKLASLTKLYNPTEKYTGSINDNLNFKLNIFLKKCEIANINDNDIKSSIFVMFSEEAF